MDTVQAAERVTIFVIVEKQSPTQTFLCVVALHTPPPPPPQQTSLPLMADGNLFYI